MTADSPDVRTAYEARDWNQTLEILSQVEEEGDLGADDLLLKADALYWTGRFDEAMEAFEAGYSALVKEERPAEAGLVAALLAYFAMRRQAYSVGGGWLKRAESLLEDQPDSLGQAWLKLLRVGQALFVRGELESALELSEEAIDFARRIDAQSSESLAMSFKAIAMIQEGDWQDGLGLVDEAMVVARGGDDLRMTSDVYCNTISICRNLGDYRRAEEWTEEAERWMRANSVTGYTGACQVHRAELKMIHGKWVDAEEEARRATKELERFHLVDYLGSAHYAIGEVRRRMGDSSGAEREFGEAYSRGHDAQPGLALLMRDRGDVEGALASIRAAARRRDEATEGDAYRGPSRARLLPALVEIALAAGEVDVASSAADELDEIAEAFDSSVWRASAAASKGSVMLARGQLEAASRTLETAREMYQRLGLPYEMARTRVVLSKALDQAGDVTAAELERRAARTALMELGATREARDLADSTGQSDATATSAETRVVRTFMFTDIVKSTDLIGIIGDSAWRDLLAWHNRTLQSAIEGAGGEVVRFTGDGYFASFSGPREGIECAVDIQRRLARHRRESGFALLVRIGLHQTEAMREQGDYSGGGIHAAARIGAIADAEEIALTTETLRAAGPLPYPTGNVRSLQLKGIANPVEVCNLEWR